MQKNEKNKKVKKPAARDEFFAATVTKVLGINQNLISQWVARGHISATWPASGSGTRHVFTSTDVLRLELFRNLNLAGFAREVASEIAFSSESFVNSAFTNCIEKVKKNRAKKREAHEARFLLTGLISPDPVYFAFAKTKQGAHAFRLSNEKHFAQLYRQMEKDSFFYVFNLTLMASSILDKLDRIEKKAE